MAAAKIRKGDRVVVLSGKDKGKTGEVVRSMPKDMKVVVSGVNIHARHRKPSQTNPQGGIERTTSPVRPLSVPARTTTWSPLRILAAAMITAPPAQG